MIPPAKMSRVKSLIFKWFEVFNTFRFLTPTVYLGIKVFGSSFIVLIKYFFLFTYRHRGFTLIYFLIDPHKLTLLMI